MSLTSLLSNSNVGYYNKEVARKIGLNESILLSELCSKYEYWEKQNKLKEDGYFYETKEMIEENTTLTPYQQRNALKKLEELGIVSTKLIGMPAVKHYMIHEQQLSKFFITRCEETSQQDVKKLHLSNIDNNILSTKVDNSNNTNVLLSQKSKTTKQKNKNLYEKCIDEIDSFTNNTDLRDVLVKYLNLRLSMKDKPIYGVNQWKGLLNKLSVMNGDMIAIVEQSIERGWGTFVEINNNTQSNNKFSQNGMNRIVATDDYKKDIDRWVKENGIESF